MRKCAFFWMVVAILALQVGLLSPVQAEVVGQITQVEGQVDLLKGGNLPAKPVKLQDKLESGDVVRTKSLSKAQITFIDNSIITLSPESRLAVDEYQFTPAQQKRNAVLNLFYGMAHVVVNQLFKVDQPDFVIKTQTAVTGVRGTDFGVRIQPNSSTVLNFKGVTQVGNIFPEVGELSRRAFKAAYAFGPPGSPNTVLLHDMQGTTVARGLPPTLPFALTVEDRKQFMHQLSYGVTLRKKDQGSGMGTASGGTGLTTDLGVAEAGTAAAATTSSVPAVAPVGLTTGTGSTAVTLINTVTVPPTPPAPTPTPPTPTPPTPPSGLTFSQTFTGPYALTSVTPFTVGIFASTGPGSGTRTGVYPGTFTANYNWSAVWVNPSLTWNPSYLGTFTATMNANLTGILGQPLTGTMVSIFTDSAGGQFTLSGTVTILPTGELTYNFSGTGVSYPLLDQITVTGGTLSQTPTVAGAAAGSTVGSQVMAAVTPIVSAPIAPKVIAAVAPIVVPAVTKIAPPPVKPVANPVISPVIGPPAK
jgi:FecR protein